MINHPNRSKKTIRVRPSVCIEEMVRYQNAVDELLGTLGWAFDEDMSETAPQNDAEKLAEIAKAYSAFSKLCVFS